MADRQTSSAGCRYIFRPTDKELIRLPRIAPDNARRPDTTVVSSPTTGWICHTRGQKPISLPCALPSRSHGGTVGGTCLLLPPGPLFYGMPRSTYCCTVPMRFSAPLTESSVPSPSRSNVTLVQPLSTVTLKTSSSVSPSLSRGGSDRLLIKARKKGVVEHGQALNITLTFRACDKAYTVCCAAQEPPFKARKASVHTPSLLPYPAPTRRLHMQGLLPPT